MKVNIIRATLFFMLAVHVSACGRFNAAGLDVRSLESGLSVADQDGDNIDLNTLQTDTYINLNNNASSYSGKTVDINSNTITINKAGVYKLSGALDNGQIVVDAASSDDVVLILDSVDVTCSYSSPLFIKNAKNVFLVLEDRTTNRFEDSDSYTSQVDNEPNATIFSKDDLKILGSGSLYVSANFADGIKSKDNLRIKSGSISVESVKDALQGKDRLMIYGGNVNLVSGGAGMKASNEKDEHLGSVIIKGGNIDITAKEDAVNAISYLVVQDGNLKISADDDGLHSDDVTKISGGLIDIEKSYEGIEGFEIEITGGEIYVAAEDDGVNSFGSGDDTPGGPGAGGDQNGTGTTPQEGGTPPEPPAGGSFPSPPEGGTPPEPPGGTGQPMPPGGGHGTGDTSKYTGKFTMTGGYLFVDGYGSGDGIDINGSGLQTGGTIIVQGPGSSQNSPNSSLDYDVDFVITGGTFIAAGNSTMAHSPSESSTQPWIAKALDQSVSSGDLLHLTNEFGDEVMSLEVLKDSNYFIYSSPLLENASTFRLLMGGTHSSVNTEDGLFLYNGYSGGSLVETFNLNQ